MKFHGLGPLHADAHRQSTTAYGPEPQRDRALRCLPHQRWTDADRGPERQRLAHAGHRCPRRPHLADDSRFATNVDRVRNRALCDTLVGAETRRWSTAELDARLAAAGIPAAQVKELDQVVDHPQLRERNRWRTIETEHASVSALLPPTPFSDTDPAMGDVPALGNTSCACYSNRAWTPPPRTTL